MIRPVLRPANASVKSLVAPRYRPFSFKPSLRYKARVSQTLEQAHSASPVAYKTVKTSSQSGNEAIRSNQIIWLVQQSMGKGTANTNQTPTPHELPWDTNRPQDEAPKGDAAWEGLTVWPYLW